MTGPGTGAEVALLDRLGVIEWVNQAWVDFCDENDGDQAATGVGVSYLAACAAAGDDDGAPQVRVAIEAALAGQLAAPVVVAIPRRNRDGSTC